MRHADEGTLHSFLDGELSPAEVEELERHLSVCVPCRALLAEAGYPKGFEIDFHCTSNRLPGDGALCAALQRFDGVLTHEQHCLTPHHLRKQSFISLQLFSLIVDGGEFDWHRAHTFTGTLNRCAQTHIQIRAESEAKIVAARLRFARRGLLELYQDFSRGDW